MPQEKEVYTDIIQIIKCFDIFLDNMYERNCFDAENIQGDKEIDEYVKSMKIKYHVK